MCEDIGFLANSNPGSSSPPCLQNMKELVCNDRFGVVMPTCKMPESKAEEQGALPEPSVVLHLWLLESNMHAWL